MATNIGVTGESGARPTRRQQVRYAGAALAGLTAFMYLLIGFNIVTVVELAPGEASGQAYFGLPAALAYALGAFLLLRTERRILWILGALLQLFVIGMYLGVSTQRVPAFEMWGILIRIAQVLLLGVLLYLILRPANAVRKGSANS